MSVLSEFREAIQIQQQKDDEAYEEQISLPLDERVAKGVTMHNLRVEFDFYDHDVHRYIRSFWKKWRIYGWIDTIAFYLFSHSWIWL